MRPDSLIKGPGQALPTKVNLGKAPEAHPLPTCQKTL